MKNIKTNEIFIKTSFKHPTEKEMELGQGLILRVEAVVVAKQYQDNQDGSQDIIIKVKPTVIEEISNQ